GDPPPEAARPVGTGITRAGGAHQRPHRDQHEGESRGDERKDAQPSVRARAAPGANDGSGVPPAEHGSASHTDPSMHTARLAGHGGSAQMAGVNRLMKSNSGAIKRVHSPLMSSTPMALMAAPLTPANHRQFREKNRKAPMRRRMPRPTRRK